MRGGAGGYPRGMTNDTAPGFAKPTDEHTWIMTNVGKWNVDCKFFMDPSQPPMEVKATDTCEAFGQFFTLSRFEADMFGMPFRGISTQGFDSVGKQFVSTWADTMNPHLYHFTGRLDVAKKVLDMRAKAPAPMSGTLTDWRTREEHVDAKTRKFEMFVTMPGGPEVQLLSYVYRRA